MNTFNTHSIADRVSRRLSKHSHWGKLPCLAVGLALLSASTTSLAQSGLSQVDMCQKLNQRTDRVPVKPVAKPPYLRLFNEPTFATKVMRISNSAIGSVTKPGNDAAQAWNADETRMMLHHYDNSGKHSVSLLDGISYAALGTLKLPTLAAQNVHWSQQDANILYYVPDTEEDAGKLTQLNIKTAERSVIADFAPYCEKRGVPAQGGILAAPSATDELFGFRCGIRNEKSLAVSFQASNSTVSTLNIGKGSKWPINTAPKPFPNNGNMLFSDKILNRNLKTSGNGLDIASIDAPFAIGAVDEQQNRFFQSATKRSPRGCKNDIWNGIGLVVVHGIEDSSCSSLITQTKGYPETPSGTSLAANAHQNPRWLAMTSVGYDDFEWFSSKRPAPLLFSEVVLLDTTASEPAPCRLAHNRTFGEQATNATYEPALGKASVSLSPKATRVLFSSDWYDSGSIDTYVVQLPAYTQIELDGLWVDANNTSVTTEFNQIGGTISFQRTTPNTQTGESLVVIGVGEISAEQINLNYEFATDVDRVTKGTCTGTQSSDSSETVLVCRNDVYGVDTTYTLVRPE